MLGKRKKQSALFDVGNVYPLALKPLQWALSEERLSIDLEHNQATYPAGLTSATFIPTHNGGKRFRFGSACSNCPLRSQCTSSPGGRMVQVHPQEALLRAARERQREKLHSGRGWLLNTDWRDRQSPTDLELGICHEIHPR